MRNKALHITSAALVGLILLVSGFAKAADAAYFSNIVWNTFHTPWMAYASAALILLEILLGGLLLTQWKRRLTAGLTALFILVVTGVYLYGVLQYGMTNCGCFGHLRALNLPPVWTMVRNTMLVALLLVLVCLPPVQKGRVERDKKSHATLQIGFTALLLIIGAFTTGYTLNGASVFFSRSQQWQGHTVADSPLANLQKSTYQDLQLSSDSDYLVFAFSFTCPFCQMAVGNASWYERSGMVDRVIGLAVADSSAEQHFLQAYGGQSPLNYRTLPLDFIQSLAPDLPTTYWVQHDTIRNVWTGEVPPVSFLN